ncbi:MAG TPA: protein-disulfide reductase DsbD, partial [Povalibacter sp.]
MTGLWATTNGSPARRGCGLLARIGIALAGLGVLAPASAADDFLPPQQAYQYSARIENDQLIVSWTLEKGYYLYKKKMGVASTMATVQLGEPAWPKGEEHSDEYFGEQEIYRGKFEVPVPITFQGARPSKLAFELKLQGCADAGLCYPPQKWQAEASVPAAAAKSGGTDLRSFLKPKTGSDEFLPPDEAFRFGAGMERADSAALTWIIADGYYLYKHRISVASDTVGVQVGAPVLPQGEPKHDEFFGETEVYHELLEASVPVARAAGSTGTLTLNVTYQGCAEGGLCYNPITKTVSVELPPTPTATVLPAATAPSPAAGAPVVAEQDRLAAALRGGNLAYAILTFFGAGLLLSLTPCVLPMIPILSGIIVGQGENVTRKRSFALAFTYVQGMALTYAAAGAIFVLAFKQAPQAFFQQPWIITLMVLLFVALAFAMFGAYTLQLPSALQSRLTDVSNRQKSGTYIGTFIMGALSALVVTACVAPAIIAALSVISQSRQIVRGAVALYATGLGMGVPLLIVGASAGTLLPKAGPWMDTVKQLFGVLFIGVAIYLAQPLLPDTLTMLLWSGLAGLTGFWIFSLKGRGGAPIAAPIRAIGLMALVYGILLLIGAASGSHDPLQPLSHLRAGTVAGNGQLSAQHGLAFRRIKSIADLDREVAAAGAAGKPVMIDFYA